MKPFEQILAAFVGHVIAEIVAKVRGVECRFAKNDRGRFELSMRIKHTDRYYHDVIEFSELDLTEQDPYEFARFTVRDTLRNLSRLTGKVYE